MLIETPAPINRLPVIRITIYLTDQIILPSSKHAYSALGHIVRSLWLGRYRAGDVVMICSAHFDASGKAKDHVITVTGGISSVGRWVKFERDWNQVLVDDGLPEGTVFHMTDFAVCQGPFKIYEGKSAKKAALFSNLVSCIVKHVGKMFSISVVVEDYRSFDNVWRMHELFGSVHTFAGLMCVRQSLEWMKRSNAKRTKPLQVFFEKGDENERELDALCQEHFSIEPTFRNKKMVQFQPADLLGWKNRTAVTNAFLKGHEGGQETLSSIQRSLQELERIHATNGVYDKDAFAKILADGKYSRREKTLSLVMRS